MDTEASIHPVWVYLLRCGIYYSTIQIHCVQKKTPTHIFFHISMNY